MRAKEIFYVGMVAVVLLGITGSGYFYVKYKQTQEKLKDPSVLSNSELQQLLVKVGKLIELPQGEIPTVATVSDEAVLKDQPFFARARNGDKVLIYKTAKKAILYDPVANRIRDVGPVNIDSTVTSTDSAAIEEEIAVQATPTIAQ